MPADACSSIVFKITRKKLNSAMKRIWLIILVGCRPIILYYSFMYPFFLVTSRRHLLLLHYMMYIFSRWPLHQSETRVNESNITIRELPRISYNVQLTPIVFSDVDHTHFDRRSDCNNLASHWLIALMCLDFGPD